MIKFKAFAKNKQTKQYEIIELAQVNKTKAIKDIRSNGYMVDPNKVKKAEIFDYIINNTDCQPWDWKDNN